MAGGVNPIGNLPGKVNSSNALLVTLDGPLPNGSEVSAGTGSAEAALGGVLTVSTTQTGTTAVTTEEDLWTYSLPANTLSANGKAIRITAYGTLGANANSKTIRLYFGAGTAQSDTTTGNAAHWRYTAIVTRTGASAQVSVSDGALASAARGPSVGTLAADTTGAITIKVTGQNGTASANDIVFRGAIVEALG